jgi:hypothetical protein
LDTLVSCREDEGFAGMTKIHRIPDTSVRQQYEGHDWIETLYSRTKQYRAVITLDASAVYRVYRNRWNDSDWAEWGTVLWEPWEKSIADTIDRARTIAKELRLAPPDGLASDDNNKSEH